MAHDALGERVFAGAFLAGKRTGTAAVNFRRYAAQSEVAESLGQRDSFDADRAVPD
jgi:hypothetical protein